MNARTHLHPITIAIIATFLILFINASTVTAITPTPLFKVTYHGDNQNYSSSPPKPGQIPMSQETLMTSLDNKIASLSQHNRALALALKEFDAVLARTMRDGLEAQDEFRALFLSIIDTEDIAEAELRAEEEMKRMLEKVTGIEEEASREILKHLIKLERLQRLVIQDLKELEEELVMMQEMAF